MLLSTSTYFRCLLLWLSLTYHVDENMLGIISSCLFIYSFLCTGHCQQIKRYSAILISVLLICWPVSKFGIGRM